MFCNTLLNALLWHATLGYAMLCYVAQVHLKDIEYDL